MGTGGDACGEVAEIVLSDHGGLEPAEQVPVVQHFEAGMGRVDGDLAKGPGRPRVAAIGAHNTAGPGKQFGNGVVPVVREQDGAGGQVGQKAGKGVLDGVQIAENIGMVEFDAGQHRHVRMVVQELGPLVEKGGVVFIAFKHDPVPLAHPVVAVEVGNDAPDEKGRIQTRCL